MRRRWRLKFNGKRALLEITTPCFDLIPPLFSASGVSSSSRVTRSGTSVSWEITAGPSTAGSSAGALLETVVPAGSSTSAAASIGAPTQASTSTPAEPASLAIDPVLLQLDAANAAVAAAATSAQDIPIVATSQVDVCPFHNYKRQL